MKKKDLTKRLQGMGGFLTRQGAGDEVWNVKGTLVIVPRHREINEITASKILKTAEKGRRN